MVESGAFTEREFIHVFTRMELCFQAWITRLKQIPNMEITGW